MCVWCQNDIMRGQCHVNKYILMCTCHVCLAPLMALCINTCGVKVISFSFQLFTPFNMPRTRQANKSIQEMIDNLFLVLDPWCRLGLMLQSEKTPIEYFIIQEAMLETINDCGPLVKCDIESSPNKSYVVTIEFHDSDFVFTPIFHTVRVYIKPESIDICIRCPNQNCSLSDMFLTVSFAMEDNFVKVIINKCNSLTEIENEQYNLDSIQNRFSDDHSLKNLIGNTIVKYETKNHAN